LVMHLGQLVQYAQQRQDGWAFGSVIFDEEKNRQSKVDDDLHKGVSAQSGWFPLDRTDLPNDAQMKKLQDVMGGEGATALQTPEHWEQVKDMKVAQHFVLSDGKEKQDVIDHFKTTLAPGVEVARVERIQNVTLWQSYAVKRQTMCNAVETTRRTQQSPIEQVEKKLFHGTTDEIVLKITQQGFNRSFAGRNATFYGRGTYFARDAEYSRNPIYAKPDEKGYQLMFLCRVAVGSYCLGTKETTVPDVKDAATNTLHDTTVDNVASPSIYVTYHDGQAYPEYLIKFKMPPTVSR